VKDNCSAQAGSSISQATETSLAHSSEYKNPDTFRGYPKEGEYKR
jgi:hypothetical protein